MKELYYKTPKTVEEVTSVRALSEKIIRLEQALEQAQNCGTPRQHEILEEMAQAHQRELKESKEYTSSLQKKITAMRNCDNCNERFCDSTNDHGAVEDCENNEFFHWELYGE